MHPGWVKKENESRDAEPSISSPSPYPWLLLVHQQPKIRAIDASTLTFVPVCRRRQGERKKRRGSLGGLFNFPGYALRFASTKEQGSPGAQQKERVCYMYTYVYIFIQRFKEIKRDWSYAQCYTACVCVCVQADVSRCFYVVKCCSPFPLFVGYCYEGRDGCGKKQFACNISRFFILKNCGYKCAKFDDKYFIFH